MWIGSKLARKINQLLVPELKYLDQDIDRNGRKPNTSRSMALKEYTYREGYDITSFLRAR